MTLEPLEIFLVCAPGLESVLAQEAEAARFRSVRAVPGGVSVAGGWDEVRRANISLRGASRVLARIDQFGAAPSGPARQARPQDRLGRPPAP